MIGEIRKGIRDYNHRISFLFVIGTILISATYALIEQRGFSEDAAIWPRMLAVFIILGCILIIFSDYLPEQFQVMLEDKKLMGGEGHDFEEETPEADDEEKKEPRLIGGALFTVLSSTGYILLGYLIGLLWATPIFTFVYMWNARVSYWINVPLTVGAYVIAYGFYEVVYLPIDGGVLLEEGLLSLVMFP